jgi:hypothetical protein
LNVAPVLTAGGFRMSTLTPEAPVPNFRRFIEHPDNPFRLGRHQMHDLLDAEREAFLFLDRYLPIQSVTHQEFEPVWDQGSIGDCTMNAAYGCLVTAPFGQTGVSYTEADVLAGYELETRLDNSQIPGSYPPDDTGSSGPWSMMALEKLGKIASYVHTRDTHTALRLLNRGPISIGVTWYQSMFTLGPGDTIVVDEASGVAGGHQVCVVANDVAGQRVRIRNSWGASWGDEGHAWLSWVDLDFLLHDGGEAVQPVMAEGA